MIEIRLEARRLPTDLCRVRRARGKRETIRKTNGGNACRNQSDEGRDEIHGEYFDEQAFGNRKFDRRKFARFTSAP